MGRPGSNPYSLNKTNPLEVASKNEPNHVDNVEVIDAGGAVPGKWKLEVRATSFKAGTDQDFALVISGLRLATTP